MSILSTNLYGSSINKGMGGLMSGLDTDDLVNQMTAGTRNKINRQYQAKQKLLYKQEAYREISSKLQTFNNKYFSYSSGSKTNILSSKFFESYTFKSSSNYVNVTGNAGEISNFKINSITSVAKAATYTTTNPASSQSFSSDAIPGSISEDVLLSSSITFNFNGVKKTIELSEMSNGKPDGASYTYDAEGLADFLNTKLTEVYGAGNVNAELYDYETSIIFSSSGSTNVFSVSNISSELSILTGIKSGDSNRLNVSASIGSIYGEDAELSISINGKSIDGINKDMSISEVLKKINKDSDVDITYSNITDKFVIVSKDTGKASKIEITGELADNLFGGSIGSDIEITGEDTVMNVSIHGQDIDIARSNANFSIDGINIELNKNAILLPEETPITFDVINNTDEVIERVKQFVDDYNEIIDLLSTKTKEKPSRDYPPLTPEQQDEMEEKEIENWLKEAKKGVLFGDKNINTLLNKLRASMFGMTSVSDFALSNIGIASASMDTSGKLVFNEELFREKLIEAPDEISSLFTGIADEPDEYARSGIANQILDILKENIGTLGSSGKLIDEAGSDSGRTSDQNNISLKIKDYDEKMAELKKSLEKERQRYWNQFSALEQSLNKLNAQSSWLMDMMGGY